MSILATIATIASIVTTVCTTVAAICKVAECVVDLGKALGLIGHDVEQESLGERCLAAEEAGITPEHYDNDYSAYLKAVNQFDMSEVDRDKWTPAEKAMKAIELTSSVIVHELGPKAGEVIIAIANHPESQFYTTERMSYYLTASDQEKMELSDCMQYMAGKPVGPVEQIREDLANVECEMDPSITKEQALDIIDYYREVY